MLTTRFEVVRNYFGKGEAKPITNALDIVRYAQKNLYTKSDAAEKSFAIFLNKQNWILGDYLVGKCSCTEVTFVAKTILKIAIDAMADKLVLVHNHPYGNPAPSHEDIRRTNELRLMLKSLDITLLDHVIISDDSYFSFTDEVCIKMPAWPKVRDSRKYLIVIDHSTERIYSHVLTEQELDILRTRYKGVARSFVSGHFGINTAVCSFFITEQKPKFEVL